MYLDRPSHNGVRLAHHCLIYIILDTTYLILGEWSLLLLKVPVMRLSCISPNRYYKSSMVYHMYIAMLGPQPATFGPTSSGEAEERISQSFAVDIKNLCLYSPKPCVCFYWFKNKQLCTHRRSGTDYNSSIVCATDLQQWYTQKTDLPTSDGATHYFYYLSSGQQWQREWWWLDFELSLCEWIEWFQQKVWQREGYQSNDTNLPWHNEIDFTAGSSGLTLLVSSQGLANGDQQFHIPVGSFWESQAS